MINEKNLIRLRDYVKNNVTQEMFDMRLFRDSIDGTEDFDEARNREEYLANCGTIGCLLGYIIHAIPEIDLSNEWQWDHLSNKYLGIKNGLVWEFLFSSDWAKYPEFNTPQAAVERIDLLLKHGAKEVKYVMLQVEDLRDIYQDLRF